jgi:hypothetical protein
MATHELATDLREARADLLSLIDRIRPESLTTPGLVGEWSARELIAHVGYWAGHATEIIHLVEQGRAGEIDAGQPSVDERNATVARIAMQSGLDTVRRREAASVEALLARLESMDPELLSVVLPDGATLAEGIAEDAADHYREHAEDLRHVLGDGARE